MKTGVVTGTTGAIGKQILKQLLEKGHFCILPVRNEAKAQASLKEIGQMLDTQADKLKVQVVGGVHFDSIAGVNQFVTQIKSQYQKLDFLVNNAAIVTHSLTKSQDNIETMFQVNVVSYWQLMVGFKPLLEPVHGKVVNVASDYAGDVDLQDLMFEKRGFSENAAYRQSKACNRLISAAAAKRFDKVLINACHPGVVTSNVLQGVMGNAQGWDSAEDAATTPVFLATSDKVTTSGGYWRNLTQQSDPYAERIAEQDELWAIIQRLTSS